MKKNSYKKFGLIMLAALIGGGILGFVGAILMGRFGSGIEAGVKETVIRFQGMLLPAMAAVLAVTVIYGELNLRRQREICRKLAESEDEECDRWDYEHEKIGARGMIVNILSQVICVLVLSLGYSIKYIEGGGGPDILTVCAVFLICFVYDGFWQVRFVKVVQKINPEKQADITARDFQKQWLENCDEAEREMIYQSAYKSYVQTNKWIPLLLVVTMLGHLFFNTGIMAIVVVAVIWLVVSVSYLKSCVRTKKAKLRG